MIRFDQHSHSFDALDPNGSPALAQARIRVIVTSRALLTRFLFLLSIYFLPSTSHAQCSNSVKLSCGVYTQCFERYCPCSADKNYFTNYGKRYCEKFLGRSDWSAQGAAWRDKTLLCLQESIVPKLDLDHPEKCDCSKMKDFAFQTHISCYSQNTASICRLPASDWAKIIQRSIPLIC